ncbi:hypothetical protein K493DRAFT_340718 [Basidiobolus meristosporus CBS 931.73]|uniref:Sequence orphan n=1 Tax=Basidiobolus meristosporus CBS 931.73 TaxID=1314790 RepID=A0A1Y1XVK5_9FUNG|nr:hypothetical protein K493DRAFT_340718 [Basidiobolus meristosporus CBS 931.73]|eukprot:ORX89324.1 hypothetical protein K493DRAFT_340718 [Basidiobolus meristosporus CBS 931.73]
MRKAILLPLLVECIAGVMGIPVSDVALDSLCYEHPNSFEPNYIVPVECHASARDNARVSDEAEKEPPTMRLVSFKCTESVVTCEKAKATFQIAFDILRNVIDFKRTVNVKAAYVNYCEDMDWCHSSLLGYAGPARSIKLNDSDGKRRLYPQALVKQMELSEVPEFSGVDIQATFNSEARFWFQVDPNPIKRRQYDFLSVILHELIHGLGFTTQWDNYFKIGLTPRPNFQNLRNGGTRFVGFTENAFDQYLAEYPSMTRLTEIADQISNRLLSQKYESGSSGWGIFRKLQDTVEAQITQDLLSAGTRPNAIVFLPKNAKDLNDTIFLETSIGRFTQGSSLCHLDYQSNLNSPDFVMKYKSGPGSIQAKLRQVKQSKYSPIGPQLIGILETLGYAINTNPKPLSEILPNWQTLANTEPSTEPEEEDEDGSNQTEPEFLLW